MIRVRSRSKCPRNCLFLALVWLASALQAATQPAATQPAATQPAAPAPVAPASTSQPPTVTITAIKDQSNKPLAAPRYLTNGKSLKLDLKLANLTTDTFTLNITANGLGIGTNSVDPTSLTPEIPLPDPLPRALADGTVNIVVTLLQNGQLVDSKTQGIELETTSPVYVSNRLLGASGGTMQLLVRFQTKDIDPATAKKEAFKLSRTKGTGFFQDAEAGTLPDPSLAGDTLTFQFGPLIVDTYKLEILGPGDPGATATILANLVGNQVKHQEFTFVAYPDRQLGEQVDYPRFLKAGTGGPKIDGFDPGDAVSTRVIRLFYYRDANKVVEIINRDAKRLNAGTVDRDRFLAQEARTKAESLTDGRRMQEILARQAVTQARDIQDKINKKQQDLQAQLQQTPIPAAGTPVPGPVDQLQKELGSLANDLKNAQLTEITESNKAIDLQAQENRSIEDQWRREVAAAKADYGTYAKGRINSFDSVTQVSMAVIGEGLIQCRGPVKGINKIARMIHQIDVPVGQVKVGIHTVQFNGEHGDRMEYVYEKVDKHIAHCRFLTNQSLQLFRNAVQKVASHAALLVDQGLIPPGCEARPGRDFDFRQLSRDQKYIYAFFGKDFIDELYRMDSELLRSDNKLISLHSMDTISLAGALYLTALAKNEIREAILREFEESAQKELPRIEVDYVRALTTIRAADPYINCILTSHFGPELDAKDARKIWEKAARTYQFSNLVGFFNHSIAGNDTMNSVQFATLRLAQAIKAQLVADIEYNNLIVERSLLEATEGEIELNATKARKVSADFDTAQQQQDQKVVQLNQTVNNVVFKGANVFRGILVTQSAQSLQKGTVSSGNWQGFNTEMQKTFQAKQDSLGQYISDQFFDEIVATNQQDNNDSAIATKIADAVLAFLDLKNLAIGKYRISSNDWNTVIVPAEKAAVDQSVASIQTLRAAMQELNEAKVNSMGLKKSFENARKLEQAYNKKLFAKRLLDQFMDETEQKSVELLEAMRSHVSNVDNYLKRMTIALEDDVMAQFYNPAFQAVRRASRFWDVTFSQVETTTILTNNRALAMVQPGATMEFDLPKRDILIKEGFQGAKALAQTYGELLNDKTFLSAAAMLSPTPAVGEANSTKPVTVVNGQPPQNAPAFGTALDALIPPPAVYKFETGTGYTIHPVIQPDGQSILYNFDYMYSTHISEPVRADEKHLGRINRHYIHTDVQTGNYELRELSRYNVALKAARTGKGVPLLQDIPGLGILFRPLPSAESSLQQNIILASSVIYPTTFELMGLHWSPYADDLNSPKLARQKDAQLQRKEQMRQELLSSVRLQVNDRIGIENKGTLIEEGPPHEGPFTPEVPIPSNQPPIIEGTRSTFPGSSPPFTPPMPTPYNGSSPQHAPKFVPMRISPANNSPSKPAEQGPLLDGSQSSLNKAVIRGQTGSDPGDNQPFMRNAAFRSQQAVDGEARPDMASNPQLAAAFSARGLDYLNRKDYDRALADCTQAVQLDPRSAQAHSLRGLANFFKNNPDRALVDFNNALALDATYAAVYTNRAMVNNSRKNYTGAIADCNQAIRFQPNLVQAYFNRYLAHQGLGNLDQARQDYETALRLDPGLGKR
jgi:hypothetical protein